MPIVDRSGSGPIPAKIMAVGEAFGAEEERLGEPFVGASGQELNRMFHEAGIMRTEVYLTNIVNARPSGNEISQWLHEKKSDIPRGFVPHRDHHVHQIVKDGIKRLYVEIAQVQPNLIVCLGGTSLWALTGLNGIMKWRGSHLKLPDTQIKLIPTIHPAAILRQWELRAATVEDLRRVRRESLSTIYADTPNYQFILRPSFTQVIKTLNALIARLDLGENLWLDFDLETRNGHIACAGISWSVTEAICIPFMATGKWAGYWAAEEETYIVYLLYKLLTHQRSKIRWQNGLYDAQYTFRHWHFVPRGGQDTMISQHTIFCALPKALAFQASMYARHYVYWKDEGKTWDKHTGEEQLWHYNCLDCTYTREVGESELETVRKLKLENVHQFQQQLFEPVLYAMLRGVRIIEEQRAALTEAVQKAMNEAALFFITALGHDLNINSPLQMMKLFYDDLAQQKIMTRAKKGKAPHLTCDDEALQKIAAREPILKPFINAIADRRTLGVFMSTFLKAELDEDNRMRCSYNIGGSTSGKSAPYTFRLSSSQNAFGSGCFPPGAEVLTKQGWILIETVVKGTTIAAFDANTNNLSWLPATPFSKEFTGYLYTASGEQYYTSVTAEHRILATKAGRLAWRDYRAETLAERASQHLIPISGNLQGGDIRFTAERLLVASLADGSYEDNRVRFMLKKTRKQERLIELCALYDIELRETFCGREGYRRFWFRKPEDWPKEKRWDSWVYELAQIAAKEMLDEVRHWDATKRGQSFWFFSADRKQAEIVQTLAHLVGYGGTMRQEEQNEGSYSTTTMYVVNVKPRNTVSVEGKHWTNKIYRGLVYCVSVHTTYFLVRQNGFISITGNSNLQNIPSDKSMAVGKAEKRGTSLRLPNIRSMFGPDLGYTFFDMDLDRADLQVVVWEADDKLLKAALKLGADIHLLNAYSLLNKEPPPLDELVETHPKYPDHRIPLKRQREFAKRFVHATNYYGSARTIAASIGETVQTVERAQTIWFSQHPGIQAWHKRTEEFVKRHHYIDNRFGYRWYIFDRLEGGLPEWLAWVPQSTVGCLINRIWKSIWDQERAIEVLLQVHDSLAGQFPSAGADYYRARLLELARIAIPYEDPLTIPVGIKTSEISWGDVK